MKIIGNILFIIVSIFIIIIAAYAGATRHDTCNECSKAVTTARPVQFYVETGEIGLGYMLANW